MDPNTKLNQISEKIEYKPKINIIQTNYINFQKINFQRNKKNKHKYFYTFIISILFLITIISFLIGFSVFKFKLIIKQKLTKPNTITKKINQLNLIFISNIILQIYLILLIMPKIFWQNV